ncbi:MAG: hypothetical protein ACI843_002859 [Psychrobacter glaciei]|jgi:hypothetical protein
MYSLSSKLRDHVRFTVYSHPIKIPRGLTMKSFTNAVAALILMLNSNFVSAETSVLFIGNSFTYGFGSATRYYRADSVTDLNNEGVGGVPALFKSFTAQVGLDYDVYLETRSGSALDFHLENKLPEIGSQPWDQVVMHGYSTLDLNKPGDPALLIETTVKMSTFLQQLNPNVEVFLTATWSRADLIYKADRQWSGTPIEKMALDVRAGYNKAAAAAPPVKAVNGVGEAWTRAMFLGIADTNPYDGIEFGKVSLWSWDYYHASDYGYYLQALVVFGNLTALDPRSLGENECSGFELGMSRREVNLLQQAAFEQLASEKKVKAAPLIFPKSVQPKHCALNQSE